MCIRDRYKDKGWTLHFTVEMWRIIKSWYTLDFRIASWSAYSSLSSKRESQDEHTERGCYTLTLSLVHQQLCYILPFYNARGHVGNVALCLDQHFSLSNGKMMCTWRYPHQLLHYLRPEIQGDKFCERQLFTTTIRTPYSCCQYILQRKRTFLSISDAWQILLIKAVATVPAPVLKLESTGTVHLYGE